MSSSNGTHPRWRRSLHRLQRAFLLLAIVCIGFYLAMHWQSVGALFGMAYIPYLLAAALGLALLHPVMAFGFWRIQRGMSIERSYGHTLASYVTRLPARFVPGGIWHSLARYADIRGDNHASTLGLGRLFIAEVIATASSGCLVSGVLALTMVDAAGPARFVAFLMLLAGMVGSLAVIVFVPIQQRRRSAINWFAAIAAIGIAWIAMGAIFAVVAAALEGPFVQCSSTALASTYTTAATAGNVAIFAPQGWGVTDAVFAFLRPCPIPLPALLSAILALRLVSMASDLCTWVLGITWVRLHATRRKPS